MDKKLTPQEEKFCLIYTSGPAPYNGNALKSYELVFNGKSGRYRYIEESSITDEEEFRQIDVSLEARKLMARDDIKERIDQLMSENIVSASTLRPRLTETLLKIIDECSTITVEDRFGCTLSPAALRSVAVNAISKLTEIYGIKEDIAHKVMLEGGGDNGITFNLIVPGEQKSAEELEFQ